MKNRLNLSSKLLSLLVGTTLGLGATDSLAQSLSDMHSIFGVYAEDRMSDATVTPDATGDGIPDILIYSEFAEFIEGNNDDFGRITLIDGRSGEEVYSFTGEAFRNEIGEKVTLAGDLDGDGLNDFFTWSPGAYSSDGKNRDFGMVQARSLATGSLLWDLRGIAINDRLVLATDSVDSDFKVPDLDGDGAPEAIVVSSSADSAPDAFDNVGMIRMVSGATGATIWELRGTEEFDNLKFISFIYDLNGDGVRELVAYKNHAAPEAGLSDFVGSNLIVSGSDGTIIKTVSGFFGGDALEYYNQDDTNQPIDLEDPKIDFDGDGRGELLFKAERGDSAEGAGDNVGYFRVFSSQTLEELFTVYGAATGDSFPVSVEFPGDLNADQVSDLFLGASGADSTEGANDNIGRVRAISGADGTLLYSQEGRFSGDGFCANRPQLLRDFNNDGVGDVLCSNRRANSTSGANDRVGFGRVFSGATGATLFEFAGTEIGMEFGFSAVDPGDLNGDNVPDLVVDAPFANIGEFGTGYFAAISGVDGSILWVGPLDAERGSNLTLTNRTVLEDFNNDGVPDVWVGQQPRKFSTAFGEYDGVIRIVSGRDGSVIQEITGEPRLATRQLPFPSEPTSIDQSVASAQFIEDTNGDGVRDLLATFRGGQSEAVLKVVSGSDFTTLYSTTDSDYDALPRFITTGSLPDFDGDGLPDLVLSMLLASPDGSLSAHGLIRVISLDTCENDPDKTGVGICGCGIPDEDPDGDAVMSCLESCPEDPLKTEAGICGCGTVDLDSDDDGAADCNDECPLDAEKMLVGACGCGEADTDDNRNDIFDCFHTEELTFRVNEIGRMLTKLKRTRKRSMLRRSARIIRNTRKYFLTHQAELQLDAEDSEVRTLLRKLRRQNRRLRFLNSMEQTPEGQKSTTRVRRLLGATIKSIQDGF